MKTKKSDLVDFYKQLSLLLESNLPLPATLRQMASNFRRTEFSSLLFSLADKTESGAPLSEAMKAFPEVFPPFQVKMVECGERNGTLSNVLSELAYSAHIDSQLVSMVKTMAAYPAAVFVIAFSVLLFIYTFIVPNFKQIFRELLDGTALPAITDLMIIMSDICQVYFPIFVVLLLVVLSLLLWLFLSQSFISTRIFMSIIRLMPLSSKIFNNLMMARLCSMWSVLVRYKTSANEAFEIMSNLVEDARLSSALLRISCRVSEGKDLVDCLRSEGAVSDLVAVMVKHCPEGKLADELANLACIYRDRAAGLIRNVELTWEIGLIFVASGMVGIVVISLFMPLIKIIEVLL